MEIPENDFFSYFHLWLYISIWEITRIPSARLHQYTLPHWIFPDFAETAAATPPALINDEIHLPYCSAPGWFSHCNSVFSIHQCRMSRTPPLPCPMIRKIISGSFGESGLKLPQGPEGPQRGKPEPATFHKTVGVQANPHEVDTEPPPGCYDISERGKNEEALTGTDV